MTTPVELTGLEIEIAKHLELKGLEIEIAKHLELLGIEIEIEPEIGLCPTGGGGGSGYSRSRVVNK